jgi:hypothetical protein
MNTPTHYKTSPDAITPWDLQKHMQSSGSAFVDARRADAIEYAFRLKGDLLEDLKKARHCLDEAIGELGGLPLAVAGGDDVQWHNPEGISSKSLGKEHRFLTRGEMELPEDAEIFTHHGKWLPSGSKSFVRIDHWTYRTKAPLPTK